MSNVKIFRANRGEGKTKWLVGKIEEVCSQGLTPIYVGSSKDFDKIRDIWFATNNTLCPLKYIDQCSHISFHESCFFTDELLESAFYVSFWYREILGRGCTWYITMNKEDFVN